MRTTYSDLAERWRDHEFADLPAVMQQSAHAAFHLREAWTAANEAANDARISRLDSYEMLASMAASLFSSWQAAEHVAENIGDELRKIADDGGPDLRGWLERAVEAAIVTEAAPDDYKPSTSDLDYLREQYRTGKTAKYAARMLAESKDW